ncbi:MAG: thioesterase [Myxococcales bacterium]|nr:thioesterase [Deltaproteobacteria bacterium]NNE20882.1 thioesterase [Myxococcales bacterium]
MEPKTHLRADPRLCGSVLALGEGTARVSLDAAGSMAVDARGLVHGGFVFGVADYAAMLAVNDPNVVLGAAETRFLRPVRVGDRIIASAQTLDAKGRKREVRVEAAVKSEKVFEGTFTCFVLERHVLEGVGSK